VLDFRIAEGVFQDNNNAPLRDVLKGNQGLQTLFNRLEAQRDQALNRSEIGRYLVMFVDNHDSFWQPTGRFSNGASDFYGEIAKIADVTSHRLKAVAIVTGCKP
jgi:hypothetical protein